LGKAIFTQADYAAARVRDATRWLNEALARAGEIGLTVSLRLTDDNPRRLEVVVRQDLTHDDSAD